MGSAARRWGGRFHRPWVRSGSLIGVLALLVHGVMRLPAPFPLQIVLGLIWAGAVPGWLALRLLLADDRSLDGVERVLLATGLAYASLVVGAFALHLLPGPLTRARMLLFYDVLVSALLAWSLVRASARPPDAGTSPGRWDWRVYGPSLLALLLIAACFRLPNLGYSEFQGDEVAVLHKAADVLRGRDDVLFFHKKGPAEILLAALTYAAGWRINEGMARLPFTIANLAGVMGVYALGRRFLSPRAGWWAGLLVALNGFLIAFGRIVQYQSLVFLFSVLGVLCALHFRDRLDRRALWLSALFLAVGLLAHTDAIFAAVAAAFIILWTLAARRVEVGRCVRWLAGPVLVGGGLLAAFYVPFVLHPHFQVAQQYLEGRAGHPPYNHLDHFLTIGTVYNAVYYLALMGVGWVGIAAVRLSRVSRPRWLLPSAFLALLTLSWRWPGLWRVGGSDLMGAMFLALLAVALCAPGESPAWRTVLVWFGLPFLVYGFLFGDPRTHLYVLFPGASLLWGAELEGAVRRLRGKAWLLRGAVAAVLAVSAAYLYIMFVSHTPEYRRTYPAHRIHLFWVPYGDRFPREGLFGFPYRAGWKAVGYLYATGALQGAYGTNEETHITGWYIRDLGACDGPIRYYFLAEHVQDVQEVPMEEIRSAYELVGRVWVGDQVKLRMYERKPARLALADYRVEEVAAVFDRQLSGPDGPDYPVGLEPLDPLAHVQHPARLRLGSAIEFLGYSVDRTRVRPGESLNLTLYWRALAPIEASYTVFTHVEDPDAVWGQMDGIPRCGRRPTHRWKVGYVHVDHYALTLRPDTPPGPHALVAGMYLLETGERLMVTDAAGTPLGTALDLGKVYVLPLEGGSDVPD